MPSKKTSWGSVAQASARCTTPAAAAATAAAAAAAANAAPLPTHAPPPPSLAPHRSLPDKRTTAGSVGLRGSGDSGLGGRGYADAGTDARAGSVRRGGCGQPVEVPPPSRRDDRCGGCVERPPAVRRGGAPGNGQWVPAFGASSEATTLRESSPKKGERAAVSILRKL